MFNTQITTITLTDVLIRLSVAVLLGAVLGVDREYKRRPAGLRTHMLVCLGAAMTTLTSQYLLLNMHFYTDIARLGAQVIAGIGFIGSGTILVFRGHKIKGLTTAAGLWASAIMGLTVGAGFYIAGVAAAVFIILIENFFSVIERKFFSGTIDFNVIVEYTERAVLARIFDMCREKDIRIHHVEINGKEKLNQNNYAVLFLRLNKNVSAQQVTEMLRQDSEVVSLKVI